MIDIDPIDGLRNLVDRVGFEEAGRRLDRSPSTIRRWMEYGYVPDLSVHQVIVSWSRSEGARKASVTRSIYEAEGIRGLRDVHVVEDLMGVDEGFLVQAIDHRREFWDRKGEIMPEPVSWAHHTEGRLAGAIFYNGDDGQRWRLYTVDGTPFWTTAEMLEGYDTDDEFASLYNTMRGHDVRIFF